MPTKSSAQRTAAIRPDSQRINTTLLDQPITLVTHPGFANWGHIPYTTVLAAQHCDIHSQDRVLIYPCGHGALGVWAASLTSPERLLLCDSNWLATSACTQTLQANSVQRVSIASAPPSEQSISRTFDMAIVAIPKGRDLGRLIFLECYRALRPGGTLYIVGSNKEGIKSSVKDAEALFGQSQVIAYKHGNRIVLLTRPTEALSLPPSYQVAGLSSGTYHSFSIEHQGSSYIVCTRPGVFSWKKLDPGTAQLLNVLQVEPTERVLDVGCGCGIIGMLAAKQALQGHVTMLDVDSLACESARATLDSNGITAEVMHGDLSEALQDRSYTLIVSNPPFHSGHAIQHDTVERLIQGAYETLVPQGRLLVVANRFLPYQQFMAEYFEQVETLSATPQYHVICATKNVRRIGRRRS